jgi:tRNA G18 (ribose-2'-O)-methylase SpoU
MFRTADGAGLSHLYLCGITATPEHPKLGKAALGAHLTVPWSYSPNGVETASELRAGGYTVIALERLAGASAGLSGEVRGPLALVVGNERAGIDPGIAAQCDAMLSLPMAGHKSSLNAAVAFGIAVYALRFGVALASPAIGDSHG